MFVCLVPCFPQILPTIRRKVKKHEPKLEHAPVTKEPCFIDLTLDDSDEELEVKMELDGTDFKMES